MNTIKYKLILTLLLCIGLVARYSPQRGFYLTTTSEVWAMEDDDDCWDDDDDDDYSAWDWLSDMIDAGVDVDFYYDPYDFFANADSDVIDDVLESLDWLGFDNDYIAGIANNFSNGSSSSSSGSSGNSGSSGSGNGGSGSNTNAIGTSSSNSYYNTTVTRTSTATGYTYTYTTTYTYYTFHPCADFEGGCILAIAHPVTIETSSSEEHGGNSGGGGSGGDAPPPPTPPNDCAGVAGGSAYLDNCGKCVGGNTGKAACVPDCTGTWGGKAYTKICGGQTICIDGNAGMFDNQLTGQDRETYNAMITNMQGNCMQKKLLEQLNSNYGLSVKIDSNKTNYASFDACSNSIIFNSSASIGDANALTAELFHAYQEQYLNGKLSQIINDAEHNYIGGSNTEAEEKAMIFLVRMFGGEGYGAIPSQEKLEKWVEKFDEDHDFSTNEIIELTESERTSWFEALEQFRSAYMNDGSLYGTPIDYSMLPVSLLSLLSNSECR